MTLASVGQFLYQKDTLLWTPLLMDVFLAGITYPMFVSQGLDILKDAVEANDEEMEKLKANKHVQNLFDFIMVPYTGYAALLFSSTYCCYYYKECRMPTAIAMSSLMLMKKFFLGKKEDKEAMNKSKDDTLNYFYLPCYAAYFGITLYEWYTNQQKAI